MFKVKAYQRASETINHLSQSLEQAVRDNAELKTIPGVGDALSKKIIELVNTGKVTSYEKLKAEFPDIMLTLMNVSGIGPRTAMLISNEIDANTVGELEVAALDGRLSTLPRMNEKMVGKIVAYIRSLTTKDNVMPKH